MIRRFSRSHAGPALLFVSSKTCPYCIQARPQVRHAAAVLGSVVPVYEVDAVDHADVVKSLRVDGFPTILFRRANGRLLEYRGERDGRRIADWACAVSGMCGPSGA